MSGFLVQVTVRRVCEESDKTGERHGANTEGRRDRREGRRIEARRDKNRMELQRVDKVQSRLVVCVTEKLCVHNTTIQPSKTHAQLSLTIPIPKHPAIVLVHAMERVSESTVIQPTIEINQTVTYTITITSRAQVAREIVEGVGKHAAFSLLEIERARRVRCAGRLLLLRWLRLGWLRLLLLLLLWRREGRGLACRGGRGWCGTAGAGGEVDT